MDLLLIIRVCAILTVISFAIVFLNKNSKNIMVYVPVVLMVLYEILFAFYHPLLGIISIVSFAFLLIYFYKSNKKEPIHCFAERIVLYVVLMIFSCSVIVEVVETITGRLF